MDNALLWILAGYGAFCLIADNLLIVIKWIRKKIGDG